MRVVAAIVCAVMLTCLGAVPGHTEKRVALVIGNSAYRSVPALPNTKNDAADITASFERLGFSVKKVLDGTFDDMRRALLQFGRDARGSEIAVIFFAGHGMEIGGENWLIPVDSELGSDTDAENEAVSLRTVMLQVAGASSLGLVILDACRNNPFAAKMQRAMRTRAVDRGLVRTEPTDNVLVAYAAKDGTTAKDGSGRNSPFTAALLKNIETPGIEINLLFRTVRDEVMAATKREQQPFVYGSLSKEQIYLKATAMQAAQPEQVAAGSAPNVWDQAELWNLSEAIRLDPKNASAFMNRGNAYHAKGDYERAIADYNEAVRLDPKTVFVFSNRGNTYHTKGDQDRAIADYNEAIRLDPKNASDRHLAYIGRGNVYRAKGDFDRAMADYNEAIRLDPKTALAFMHRGNVYRDKGDYDRAMADYNEAVRLDPTNAIAIFNRGNAFRDKGDHDRAIADYSEAIRLNPTLSLAFNGRGNAYHIKKDYDRAIADYNDAIRLDPKLVITFYNRGLAYQDKKDYDRAIADYDEAIKLDPKYAPAISNRALALEWRNNRAVRR